MYPQLWWNPSSCEFFLMMAAAVTFVQFALDLSRNPNWHILSRFVTPKNLQDASTRHFDDLNVKPKRMLTKEKNQCCSRQECWKVIWMWENKNEHDQVPPNKQRYRRYFQGNQKRESLPNTFAFRPVSYNKKSKNNREPRETRNRRVVCVSASEYLKNLETFETLVVFIGNFAVAQTFHRFFSHSKICHAQDENSLQFWT